MTEGRKRRPGAGRPLTGAARLVPRTVRLSPDVWDWVEEEAKRRGVSQARVIEDAIKAERLRWVFSD